MRHMAAMCHKACKDRCMCDTWQAMCLKSIKREGNQFVEEESNKKERKEKKEGRKKERKREERERERGGKGNRRSDGWNSSDQEVKSVYSTRDTLQEVGILPTLVYFPP